MPTELTNNENERKFKEGGGYLEHPKELQEQHSSYPLLSTCAGEKDH